MTGVTCDRRVSARMNGKIYKPVLRPAMFYGVETVLVTKKQEAELEVEVKIVFFTGSDKAGQN